MGPKRRRKSCMAVQRASHFVGLISISKPHQKYLGRSALSSTTVLETGPRPRIVAVFVCRDNSSLVPLLEELLR